MLLLVKCQCGKIIDQIQPVFQLTAGADKNMELVKKILQALNEDSIPRLLIEQLVTKLPGPMTPQLMDGTDLPVYDWDKFSTTCYGNLLSELLKHFESNWLRDCKLTDCMRQLFVIESGSDIMLYESLVALHDGIKACDGQSAKLDFILLILKDILLSDFPTSAIISICKRTCVDDLASNSFLTQWENCVQLIISLPNRIANKLKGEVEQCFTPDVFIKGILTHIAKCLVYLSHIKLNEHVSCKPLSLLLSRIVTNFKLSPSLGSFFQVLNSWSFERNEKFNETLRDLLKNIEITSVEMIVVLILKTCSRKTVIKLIDTECLNMSTWKYALCQKIPLMTFYDDLSIVTNLVAFLGYATKMTSYEKIDIGSVLPDLMMQLLTVWADKTSMQHTPLKQHLFISKLIVLGFNYLCCLSLQSSLRVSLQSKLFKGMPSHLESTTESIRIMGMITAECVVHHLNKQAVEVEKKVDLQFDFSKLTLENSVIVDNIRQMSEFDFNSDKYELDDGDVLLEKMISEFECNEMPKLLDKGKTTCKKDSEGINPNLKQSVFETLEEGITSDLDSDDDLVAYDLSNDVETYVAKRPKYLRDVIEGLREDNNMDVWTGSLEVCEDLIYSQLPEDDESVALDLLDILVCLEKRVCCENFDLLRFSSAVAVVIVFPDAAAQYLCKQFHRDVGTYSIAQRMLILDILSSAAKSLSSPITTNTKRSVRNTSIKITTNEPNWHSIVKERIANHTKRFCQPRKPPVMGIENRFANVAGSFLFPLLRGSGNTTPVIVYHANSNTYSQEDSSLLLVHFLKTCASIVMCSVNSTSATRMGKELLEATWSFRFYPEAKVREAVIACLAAIALAVPASRLFGELYDEIMEARFWLDNIVNSQGIVGGRSCEVDDKCRAFAAQVLFLIDKALNK